MDAFDFEYWNLCQAAVWIEFREKDLVRQFAAPEGQLPDPEAYRALHFYPSMWPPGRKIHAKLNELQDRLKQNALKAFGYHQSDRQTLQEISSAHWHDIDLRPPLALDARDRRSELWSRVRVKRADVLRLWPFPSKLPDKTWYDWDEIHRIYDEVRVDEPNISERDTILAVQHRFEKQYRIKPPGRTSLQNRIKRWRSSAT